MAYSYGALISALTDSLTTRTLARSVHRLYYKIAPDRPGEQFAALLLIPTAGTISGAIVGVGASLVVDEHSSASRVSVGFTSIGFGILFVCTSGAFAGHMLNEPTKGFDRIQWKLASLRGELRRVRQVGDLSDATNIISYLDRLSRVGDVILSRSASLSFGKWYRRNVKVRKRVLDFALGTAGAGLFFILILGLALGSLPPPETLPVLLPVVGLIGARYVQWRDHRWLCRFVGNELKTEAAVLRKDYVAASKRAQNPECQPARLSCRTLGAVADVVFGFVRARLRTYTGHVKPDHGAVKSRRVSRRRGRQTSRR